MKKKLGMLGIGIVLLLGFGMIDGFENFNINETGLSLLAVLSAGLLAPLMAAAVKPWVRVPVPVAEMFLGIIIGPGVLALVQPSAMIEYLRVAGVILLFFVGGYDTDFGMLGKKSLAKATTSWLVCLLVSIPVGLGVALLFPTLSTGVTAVVAGVYIGASMIATGLTTVYPMMSDAGEMTTKIGKAISAAGVIGQFAPIVAVAILVGGDSMGGQVLNHLVFFAIVGLLLQASRKGLPKLLAKQQTLTLELVGQMGIREQAIVLVVIVGLGMALGVDRLIGAFAAGMIVRNLFVHVESAERKVIESKVKGIAFGVFVPIFFVMAGVNFDLLGMLAQPFTLILIPMFNVLKFVVRGIPGSFTLPKGSTPQEHTAVGFLISCSIAGVLAVLGIATEAGAMSSVMAAGLTGSAMLSVLVFPTIGLTVARKAREPKSVAKLKAAPLVG